MLPAAAYPCAAPLHPAFPAHAGQPPSPRPELEYLNNHPPFPSHSQAEMDLDANGSVSYAEFKALLAGTPQ